MWDVDMYEFKEQERCRNNSRKYYFSLDEQ